MTVRYILELWYETQHGHHLKCRKAQIKFSEEMQKLYDKLEPPEEQQCMGDEVI